MDYKIEKYLWTDADFETMGWHDCRIYRIRLKNEIELDIDYILQWNQPDIEGLAFTFWIAPSTLIFKSVREVEIDVNLFFDDALEIEAIEREHIENGILWTIETQQGNFQFLSEGYEMYIRQAPFLKFGQTISYGERYGISLERTINQENPNRLRDDFVEQRRKDLEDYENVKKRHLLRKEKDELLHARENKEINLTQYFARKKEIQEMLDYYDYWLKGTQFQNW